MSRFLLLMRILFIFVFAGVLFFVIKYADAIRTLAGGTSVKNVKSASTSLEKEVKQDFEKYLDSAKDQILNIKIKDIAAQIMKIQKINKDIHSAKDYIIGQGQELFK